ncbi:hypothetical protein GUA46_09845 [Muricauda sp. HICW]|uniref:DUF1436 family protein n=1 Tax=Flagellimonas chongwuensis TaxID=2697365 RepID=A0A850NHC8_9FLAO|nr:hypothetical protein [Allomuricauda chongwuensis]NVN18646.1 hypothetical protein [Allomuricauda chongwuensis]
MDWKTRRIIYKIRFNQFFRNLKLKIKFKIKGLPKCQRANVVEYPDCFLVSTIYTLKNGPGVHTDIISKVEKENYKQNELARITSEHLAKSRWGVDNYENSEVFDVITKLTGRKSIKKQMQDSKMISISRSKNHIEISPTKNGGSTGPNRGYNFDYESILLELPINEENLEKEIKRALEMCN